MPDIYQPHSIRHSLGFRLLVVLIAGLFSAIIGEIYAQIFYGGSAERYYQGARNGFLIGAIATALEVFYVRSVRRSWIRQLAFLPSMVVRILVITAIIRVCLVSNEYLSQFLLGEPLALNLNFREEVRDTLISLAIVMFCVIVSQLGSVIGYRRFANLVLGRYFRPVEEERIFLFLDLIGSTAAARNMGDLRFHDYLADFFYQIDRAIVYHRGEIVSYVGDAVIVTWPLKDDEQKNARCFQALRLITLHLERQRDRFIREYGSEPDFYAALHCGPVVVGECGDSRRQVTFLGDVVNITSRIEQACKSSGEPFIASGDLVEKISPPGGVTFRSLGEMSLRGADKPFELFAIDVMQKPNKGQADQQAASI